MKYAWFVTGTDTEIGKTLASCALLHAARGRGFDAVGMKPIAAGCDAAGANEDVQALLAASSCQLPREQINPYLLQRPIAPHLAAAEENRPIEIGVIQAAYRRVAAEHEVVVVEGVGGFRVPLDDRLDTADLAQLLGLPVILVVGMRLGCLNHALLTAESIAARGLRLAGWIANQIDPQMPCQRENLQTLAARLPAPLLGHIPWIPGAAPAEAARHLGAVGQLFV